MMRALRLILCTALFLLPLLFLGLAAPFSPHVSANEGRWLVVLAWYSTYACVCLGMILSRNKTKLASRVLPAAVLLATLFIVFSRLHLNSFAVHLTLLAALFLTVGTYLSLERHIKLQGLVSLVLFIACLIGIEATLRAVPKHIFAKEVIDIPALAPEDRGNQSLRQNGFRGRQPCLDCEVKPVRVVMMGGSSTYGIPLPSAAQAFSEQLQRLLDKELPARKFEILNAGIPGYGIVQVVDSLEKYVLQFHPDIVVINSWFNDSAKSSGWYGYPGLSDREAQDKVELIREVEGSKLYRRISKLRLYGVFRHYLLQLARRETPARDRKAAKAERRRMDPEEFKLELRRIVELGKTHHFQPVFMYEVTNRQEELQKALSKNGYYRAILEVSTESGVPLIDTITPFAARRGDWLFSDFIHPNRDGHRLIAETIFNQFLSPSSSSRIAAAPSK
ncbi:MAG: SGNH/GDSL hydrolase family protein [Deltaproteobacteria bacterium]|nr:SGNH/GDSL hydrolase family protein [Deltaproteobacteria bacterium]